MTILVIIFLIIIWAIFIRKPFNKCRWYQHKYLDWESKSDMVETNQYIDNKPIMKKRTWSECKCRKCGTILTSGKYGFPID